MTTPIDVSRATAGLSAVLPPQVSQDIWQEVQKASIIQQLCTPIEMPGPGLVVPIITGDPEAEWVLETGVKPVRRPTFGSKTLKPYTIAVIVPFSRQLVRDLPGLYNACRQRLPLAIAKKFDRTALGYDPVPGPGFEALTDLPEVDLAEGGYDALLAALSSVADSSDDADVTSWVLSVPGEIALLGEKDENRRPLFSASATADGTVRELLGRPVLKNNVVGDAATNAVGIGGDWKSAVWGYVEAVQVSVSSEATLTTDDGPLHLWERNMVGIRAECEIGFAPRDSNRFVRLTHTG